MEAETDQVSVQLSDSLEGDTDKVRGQTDAELLLGEADERAGEKE